MIIRIALATLTIFSLFFLFAVPQVAWSAPRPCATYGCDHRLDFYQVRDGRVREVARSSLAVFERHRLHADGAMWRIDPTPLATSMNVCADERFARQPSAADCSATLIAPDRVLTAGHCVNRRSCEDTVFVFSDVYALRSAEHEIGALSGDQIYSCRRIIKRANSDKRDFAVIELDREVEGRLPATLAPQDAEVGDAIYMLGHPSGLPLKFSGDAKVKKITKNYLVAEIDAFGGNSGSGIFSSASGELVGVLVRGEEDYDLDPARGCNVPHVCKPGECKGEEATHISIVLDHLRGD